jgi:AraC-like DNA-binding protein/mannose-6-phosphate isomerase-like protein (cupin superfamily)
MTAMPERLSQRPRARLAHDTAEPAQLLREALASLHLAGALFLRAEFSSPWALESPESEELARALEPHARRVILFHVVLEGRFVISLNGADHELGPGDVAILPYADRHLMRSPEKTRPVPLGAILPPRPWSRLPCLSHGGRGAVTRIACGYLYSDDLHLSPVLAAMPPLIVVRTGAGAFNEWITTNVRFALAEMDASSERGDILMQRLPELLFVKCLDFHTRGQPTDAVGWLAASTDPIVSRAIAHLHRSPERSWSLQELSRACSTSRSVLDERFRRLLGCPPMQYLTAWRLQLAARRLRTTRQTVAEIADSVGYGAVAAFSRAFKRYTGLSPRDWR